MSSGVATARVPSVVLVIGARSRDPITSCASSMLPYVDELTGTNDAVNFLQDRGNFTIAFINKGFVELVRTIPPVLSSSSLVVALPQSNPEGCLVLCASLQNSYLEYPSEGGKHQPLCQSIFVSRLSRSSFLHTIT